MFRMHLVYMDESGQTGMNLTDASQPVFVLAALIVPESEWMKLEQAMKKAVEEHFPEPRPQKFEIHAKAIRNGEGYFRQFSVSERLAFRDKCLGLAQAHGLKLIYRAIVKKKFLNWVRETFGTGVSINPHVAAFPLVARVVNEYLASLPEPALGIFIADENREIISDIEKTIHLLRGTDGSLKLSRIIEKGFFIDSSQSLALQLCDLCAYSARKKEEAQAGLPTKPIDWKGMELIEPLIYRGNEAFLDTLEWLKGQKWFA
jgi:hypothetical protein